MLLAGLLLSGFVLAGCGKETTKNTTVARPVTMILGAGEQTGQGPETELPEAVTETTETAQETKPAEPAEEAETVTAEDAGAVTAEAEPVTKDGSEAVTETAEKEAEKAEETPTPTEAPKATATPTPKAAGSFSADDCAATLNGTSVKPGSDFSSKIDAVGTLTEKEEGVACLDDGYDTNYIYSGFKICTLAKDGQQIIYDIDITLSGFKTGKGIVIGSSTDGELLAAYGEPDKQNGMRRSYTSGDRSMIVYVENGIVTEIEFTDNSVG